MWDFCFNKNSCSNRCSCFNRCSWSSRITCAPVNNRILEIFLPHGYYITSGRVDNRRSPIVIFDDNGVWASGRFAVFSRWRLGEWLLRSFLVGGVFALAWGKSRPLLFTFTRVALATLVKSKRRGIDYSLFFCCIPRLFLSPPLSQGH